MNRCVYSRSDPKTRSSWSCDVKIMNEILLFAVVDKKENKVIKSLYFLECRKSRQPKSKFQWKPICSSQIRWKVNHFVVSLSLCWTSIYFTCFESMKKPWDLWNHVCLERVVVSNRNEHQRWLARFGSECWTRKIAKIWLFFF